jgi:hypothetical protein
MKKKVMIDWDKVSEADVDYLGWNYDANDWYLAAKQAVEVTPLEARRTAEEAYKEEGELITLGDLEKVPAMNVHQAFLRSRDGDGGLEEWLYKRIMMQKDGDKWVLSSILHLRKTHNPGPFGVMRRLLPWRDA